MSNGAKKLTNRTVQLTVMQVKSTASPVDVDKNQSITLENTLNLLHIWNRQ